MGRGVACCCLRRREGGLLWGLDEDWDWGEVFGLGRAACVRGRKGALEGFRSARLVHQFCCDGSE